MRIPASIFNPQAFARAAVLGAGILLAAGLWFPARLGAAETRVIRQYLADGFDFPVGKPDGYGYYKARGFWPNGHLGEDWNGRGGGNSDLGDPVYAIGRGVVVFSADYRSGWGNVIIIRHAYRDDSGKVFMVDSQYGHLDRRMVEKYELIKRGQQIGTIGTNRGMYLAHLHLEIHKNLNLGMYRSSYSRGYENYFSPTDFIRDRRKLRSGFRMHPIPVDTFGPGRSSPTRLTTTTIPALKPPSEPSVTPPVTSSQATKPSVPEEVEEALEQGDKSIRESVRTFWDKIKSRLENLAE